jgi:hypothetical protein
MAPGGLRYQYGIELQPDHARALSREGESWRRRCRLRVDPQSEQLLLAGVPVLESPILATVRHHPEIQAAACRHFARLAVRTRLRCSCSNISQYDCHWGYLRDHEPHICARTPEDTPRPIGVVTIPLGRPDTQIPANLRGFADLWDIVGCAGRPSWCRHPDSNWGPTAYKAVALPTELCRRASKARPDKPGRPRKISRSAF